MHANLLHLILSVFIKNYFYSFIEYHIGYFKTAVLYFLGGIGGVAFNCLLTDEPGVAGTSTVGGIAFSLTLEAYLFYTK